MVGSEQEDPCFSTIDVSYYRDAMEMEVGLSHSQLYSEKNKLIIFVGVSYYELSLIVLRGADGLANLRGERERGR